MKQTVKDKITIIAALVGIIVGFLSIYNFIFPEQPIQLSATTGSISVSSTPPGARIYIDGIQKSMTPAKMTAESGYHVIDLELAGYQNFSQTIRVDPGQNSFVSVSLSTPVPTATSIPTNGSVSVYSTPPYVTIYIDGIEEGTTPAKIDIQAGSHEITLEREGYQKWSQRISVNVGQTLIVSAEIQPAIHSIGSAAIRQGEKMDLDEGTIGLDSYNDIFFNADSKYDRYLEPVGSAVIVRVGMSSVGREGCKKENEMIARQSNLYYIPSIDIKELRVGTYICVYTDRLRWSEVRVDSIDIPNGWLNISYTTWEYERYV